MNSANDLKWMTLGQMKKELAKLQQLSLDDMMASQIERKAELEREVSRLLRLASDVPKPL